MIRAIYDAVGKSVKYVPISDADIADQNDCEEVPTTEERLDALEEALMELVEVVVNG